MRFKSLRIEKLPGIRPGFSLTDIDKATKRLDDIVDTPTYAALGEKTLDEAHVVALLEQAAVRALDELLNQRDAAA